MMRVITQTKLAALVLLLTASVSQAKAPPSEIAKLGNSLTPVGAEKAGNADGSIPAWTGGIDKPIAGYKPGMHHPDPFAGEKPLFVINAGNMAQYADKLSAGEQAVFKRYPDYTIPVYPTHRSAAFTQAVYDATMANAKTAELISDGNGVAHAAYAFPFPIPGAPEELIWNHKLKNKTAGGIRYNNQAAVTTGGNFTLVKLREEILSPYWTLGQSTETINNVLFHFYQVVEGPARLAGSVLLVEETVDQVKQPRQAWVYNPGQRRVRRAPNVAYDNPGTASDGLRTNDMNDMFNGGLDRYNWTLVGKKEMYIPYNSYKLHSGDVTSEEIISPHFLNPKYVRFELHRVWIVEAKLKEGMRHINARRTFYIDEDSYQISLMDHYDNRGNLVRASEAHAISYYDVPLFWATLESHYDLPSGRYLVLGLDNQDPVNQFNVPLKASDFSPSALRKRGKR